jgi:hypothetical protein
MNESKKVWSEHRINLCNFLNVTCTWLISGRAHKWEEYHIENKTKAREKSKLVKNKKFQLKVMGTLFQMLLQASKHRHVKLLILWVWIEATVFNFLVYIRPGVGEALDAFIEFLQIKW